MLVRRLSLATPLALCWLALIVHASLYPFSGWRSQDVSPWAYLSAPWSPYWSGFDVWVNVVGYLPLGFLLALALLRSGRRRLAWLAGLLAHAPALTALCTSTSNGYGRFRPNAMAPQSILWGRDNRGAMLRVIGSPGDKATRIENRLGEPAANPYLYMASQIHAGLDGVDAAVQAPEATETPYAAGAASIPTSLADAVQALQQDAALCQAMGQPWVDYFSTIKLAEHRRLTQAEDVLEFHKREYFGRI